MTPRSFSPHVDVCVNKASMEAQVLKAHLKDIIYYFKPMPSKEHIVIA